jgi:hypothetical protein
MKGALRLRAHAWIGRFGGVHPLRSVLESLFACFGAWPIVVLATVFASRLFYPLDLEWCEGGILYQAYRLLHGLPIYVRGDPTWQPWPYPPAHTALLALIGLVDLDFWSARLVSILFFSLLCVVLCREVYRHLGRGSFGLAAGVLAVATIACAYPVVGQWYDLARVDGMMLGLVFLAAALMVPEPASLWRTAVVAVLMTTAIFTKQTAVFFVAWTIGFCFVRAPKTGLALGVMTAASSLIVLGFLQWGTQGGFWFWTVANLQKHEVDDARLVDGLRQVFKYFPVVALLPAALLLLAQRKVVSSRTVFWAGHLLAAVPASLLPYAKHGGYLNNLIPMLVLVGPVTALMAGDLARTRGFVGAGARWVLLFGLAVFIALRPLPRSTLVPDAAMWRSARELNQIARQLKGGLVIPELTFLPARTGHTNLHWHAMAIYDAMWSGNPMDEELALRQSGARWVILNSTDRGGFQSYVRHHFKLERRIPGSAQIRMLTGSAVIADELWKRR